MIPNLTAHSEGFQRVWNTSVKNWKLTIGNLNMFLFTCWWLAPPWIGDTGSAKIIRSSEYLLTDINSFAFILVSNTLCWAWPYFHMWKKTYVYELPVCRSSWQTRHAPFSEVKTASGLCGHAWNCLFYHSWIYKNDFVFQITFYHNHWVCVHNKHCVWESACSKGIKYQFDPLSSKRTLLENYWLWELVFWQWLESTIILRCYSESEFLMDIMVSI